MTSTASTTLSMPVPPSSQTFIRRIMAASPSFLDIGGVSMKRSVSTNGSPGLVISIRSVKISTIGPAPFTEKLMDQGIGDEFPNRRLREKADLLAERLTYRLVWGNAS